MRLPYQVAAQTPMCPDKGLALRQLFRFATAPVLHRLYATRPHDSAIWRAPASICASLAACYRPFCTQETFHGHADFLQPRASVPSLRQAQRIGAKSLVDDHAEDQQDQQDQLREGVERGLPSRAFPCRYKRDIGSGGQAANRVCAAVSTPKKMMVLRRAVAHRPSLGAVQPSPQHCHRRPFDDGCRAVAGARHGHCFPRRRRDCHYRRTCGLFVPSPPFAAAA